MDVRNTGVRAEDAARIPRWKTLAMVAPLLLAGCNFDRGLETLIDILTGRERNLVVLAGGPVTVPRESLVLTSAEPMKVLGRDWTSLCFALKGGVQLADADTMDRGFRQAWQGGRVSIHITLGNGERIALGRPMQSWSSSGAIFDRDELAACASAVCGTSLPIGSQITQVEISADPPLRVQGIYWRSEGGPGDADGHAAPTTAAQAPPSTGRCMRQAS